MLETALSPIANVRSFDEPAGTWVEAMVSRTYNTKSYGDVTIGPEILTNMVHNFKSNVRGQEICIDFDHRLDPAKGNQAAGWYKDFAIRPSSKDPAKPALWAQIDFTKDAQQEIIDKKWRYFSLEWDDEWTDNDGNTHNNVIMGGALTNRPLAKNMMPINFSEAMWDELSDEERKAFAVWSTAYVNSLPDSAFLYTSGGERKLPYKDKSGKIDLPHLRNAIARIPQMTGVSDAVKASLQAKARRLLGGANKASEAGLMEEFERIILPMMDESKEWEHSEPGTGNPPAPRTNEDGSDDPAITGGWRRDTPPIVKEIDPDPPDHLNIIKEGSNQMEFVFAEKDAREFFKVLDLDSDTEPAKVVETLKVKFGELDTLRKSVDAVTQEKAFAEQYPQYWAEHMKLMERDRDNTAKTFCESVVKIRKAEGYGLKETKQGLSIQAQEKIIETHKKFGEGKATIADFEECIKTITNGGILQFGEMGTSENGDDDIPEINTDSAVGIASARRYFAEAISKIQGEHPDWDYNQCLTEGAKKYPDLAEAYRIALPA